MSSPLNHEHQTARSVSIQRISKPVRCFSPTRSDIAWWAHDPYNHVTSTIPNSKPYDHTTPPSSARTNVQSQIPRPNSIPATSPAIVGPRPPSPSAACPPTPRLAPREEQKVARDASYYAVRKSATFPFVSASTQKAIISAAQVGKHYSPPRPPNPIERPSDRDFPLLRSITPLTLLTISYPVPVEMHVLNVPAIPMPQISSTPKPKIKRRRPSEIFNMAFSFSNPSRRRLSDRTPQISPRTSISSESTPTPEKRQRVDSSGPMFKCFTRSSTANNTKCSSMGPSSTGPADIWGEDDLSRYPFIHTTTEAHPGQPVDLTTISPFGPATSIDSPIHAEIETYHTYLSDSRRRTSSPDPRSRTFATDFYDCKSKLQEDRLHKEARILGLTSNIPNRKRACTLERTSRTTRRAPPQAISTSYASSPDASAKSRYSGRSSSTASDPSMEKFLTHVRRSQEKRVKKRSEGQAEKEAYEERDLGWFDLGDEPL